MIKRSTMAQKSGFLIPGPIRVSQVFFHRWGSKTGSVKDIGITTNYYTQPLLAGMFTKTDACWNCANCRKLLLITICHTGYTRVLRVINRLLITGVAEKPEIWPVPGIVTRMILMSGRQEKHLHPPSTCPNGRFHTIAFFWVVGGSRYIV